MIRRLERGSGEGWWVVEAGRSGRGRVSKASERATLSRPSLLDAAAKLTCTMTAVLFNYVRKLRPRLILEVGSFCLTTPRPRP